jgi:hypothetical protein
MPAIINPDAPATPKQLWTLHKLTGKDTREWNITKEEASEKIQQLELKKIENEAPELPKDVDGQPFTEAHVTIVEGDQRGGKTCYAVKTILQSYFKDCVRIFCEKVLEIKVEVLSYSKKTRVAKIKYQGQTKYIKIPEEYKLKSPMRIFSNVHIYGVPYVIIPSFRHMLYWLKTGVLSNGWLLADESHRGMSARNGMSAMGKDFVGEYYQLGKSMLDVIIITHHARMIDYLARLVPTKRIHCSYDKKTFRVNYTVREKGVQGTRELSFDARPWFGNYYSNEKVKAG